MSIFDQTWDFLCTMGITCIFLQIFFLWIVVYCIYCQCAAVRCPDAAHTLLSNSNSVNWINSFKTDNKHLILRLWFLNVQANKSLGKKYCKEQPGDLSKLSGAQNVRINMEQYNETLRVDGQIWYVSSSWLYILNQERAAESDRKITEPFVTTAFSF